MWDTVSLKQWVRIYSDIMAVNTIVGINSDLQMVSYPAFLN